MAYIGPELLAGDHLLDRFDCGKPARNQWLIRHVRKNQASGRQSHVGRRRNGLTRRRGFLRIGDSIDMPIVYTEVHAAEPARRDACVLPAGMAVDSRHYGRGLGAALL